MDYCHRQSLGVAGWVPLEFNASVETPPYPSPPVLGMVPSRRFTLCFAQAITFFMLCDTNRKSKDLNKGKTTNTILTIKII